VPFRSVSSNRTLCRGASALADDFEVQVGEALTLATNHFQRGKSKTMARIFITGSADGLGRMAAELLIEQGHGVVLHARSQARAPTRQKGTFRRRRQSLSATSAQLLKLEMLQSRSMHSAHSMLSSTMPRSATRSRSELRQKMAFRMSSRSTLLLPTS
jgi:hypothetical protein